MGGQNHNAVRVRRNEYLSHPGEEESPLGPRRQIRLPSMVGWIVFGPWSKQMEKKRGREAQFRTGAKGHCCFLFHPKVLCDVGENHYSLNRPGTVWGDGGELGSLLADSSHVCVARNNEIGSTKPVLSLRGKQYKLFILGAWLH